MTQKTIKTRLIPALIIIAAAAVGSYLVYQSHAATASIGLEAENGTLSGNAAKVNDTGASGGVAVKFTGTTPPPPPPVTPPPVTPPPVAPPPSGSGGLCGWRSTPPATYTHVIWIWFENTKYPEVHGNSAAPYMNSVINACGHATNAPANASPSLPNYIAATSGDFFGIHDDLDPASHTLTNDNLFRQVRTAGKTTKSYQESMTGTCAQAKGTLYAPKHNPEAYYHGGTDYTSCQKDNVPLGTPSSGALASDLTNNTLPTFSFVTPNLCNDMHNCSVTTGDTWLKSWLPKIISSSSYQSGSTAIWIIWDEYTPRPNFMIAPSIKAGATTGTAVDHYVELRTTEEQLGISSHLLKAGTAASIRSALNW